MAKIMNPKHFDKLIRDVLEKSELTPELTATMKAIKDDFIARNEIITKFGNSYEGDEESYEFKEAEISEGMKWKQKYEETHKLYIDTFMGSPSTTNPSIDGTFDDRTTLNNVIETQTQDVIEDGQTKSFDQLFEDRRV